MGFNMAKKNSKSSKGSKEQEKTVAKKSKTILKRKQLRKDKRQAKKTARREFLIKKVKGNRPRSQADDEEIPSDDEVGVKKPPKAKKAVVQKPPSDHDKMKKDMKELKRQQKKQRKTQLLAANEAEEKSIKMLEKNLGLKRRKSKNLPKSFLDDGLDYLLDACDSSKIAAFEKEIQEEESPGEDDDDDDDDDTVLRELGLESGSSDSEEVEMDNQDEYDDSEGEQEEPLDQAEEDGEDGENSNDECEEDGSFVGSENDEDLMNEPEQDVVVKEDIYGRKRDAEGNILREEISEPASGSSKYIPPALRNKMANVEDSEQKRLALQRLSRQIKGLLNRLAESNMHGIARDIERFYNSNSRNNVNQTLAGNRDCVNISPRYYYLLPI